MVACCRYNCNYGSQQCRRRVVLKHLAVADCLMAGDSDTIACITGGIAEVMFGLPEEIGDRSRGYLSDDLVDVLDRFGERLSIATYNDSFSKRNGF